MPDSPPLTISSEDTQRLARHLPPRDGLTASQTMSLPFVTLTFATSLDSALSLAPGVQTALSGPQSKAVTHFLRSNHDAICVGVGTAIADDPGLNCRLDGIGIDRQPRPIVLDPRLRWKFTRESKVMQLAGSGRGLAPFIITGRDDPLEEQRDLLEGLGGKYITLECDPLIENKFSWEAIFASVRAEGLRSIMIEGGGNVINSLLGQQRPVLVDSVILTIAPSWLGQGSVTICPPRRLVHGRPVPSARLSDVSWVPMGEDVVLCGKLI